MKRGEKFLLIIFVFIILLNLSLIRADSQNASGSEWWMYGKFLNHTASDGVSFPIIPMNYTTFATYSDPLYGNSIGGTPAVINGSVYIGNYAGIFYRLNASNISQKIDSFNDTSYNPGSNPEILSSPAVINGLVYFGGTGLDILFVLNATNLSQVINSTASASATSPVILANGFAYTHSSAGASVHQYNASNSVLIGNYGIPSWEGNSLDMPPTYSNGSIYTGSYNGGTPAFLQFNASNITQGPIGNFSYSLLQGWAGGSSDDAPLVWNNSIYFGTTYNSQNFTLGTFYELNATNVSNGSIATFNVGVGGSADNFYMPTLATDNKTNITYVYVSEAWTRTLYQLYATNLTQRANYTNGTGPGNGPYIYSETVANGFVYFGTNDGYMNQVNASNVSQLIGKVYIGANDAIAAPAYDNGFLYFGALNGLVYQLNATNLSSYLVNDTTPPQVTFNFPWNFTTYSGSFPVSISMNKNGYCNYSFNGGLSNYTLTPYAGAPSYLWYGNSPTIPDGIYTVTAYCVDSFGNINYNTTINVTMYTPPPTSGTGGLGAQGYNNYTANITTSGTTTSASAIIPNITSGTPVTVNINTGAIGVSQLTITTNKSISTANISIAATNRPSTADLEISANGSVYQAFNISTTGLNDSNIKNVTIRFQINISWFTLNHLDPTNTVLYRNTNTTPTSTNWTALPTTLISEDANYYYFIAISPGFSDYTIFSASLNCNNGNTRCFLNESQICTNQVWVLSQNCQLGCSDGLCITTSQEAAAFFQNAFTNIGLFASNNLGIGGAVFYFVMIIVTSGIVIAYITLINVIRKRPKRK